MTAVTAVVLSGKGGTAKTLWQLTMAGEASRAGYRTLLLDIDPEQNLSVRQGAGAHATGLGEILNEAGIASGEDSSEKGAKRATAEIRPSYWPGVDFIPAGASLQGFSQVAIGDAYLLHDILEDAELYERYDLILIDTGGRTGALVTQAMYAADVAYAPIAPTTDAIRKAVEARTRVQKIQKSHSLRWAGVVITGFDTRTGIEAAIRAEVLETFGDEVRAEVPRRAAVNEAFQIGDRLGDRTDVPAQGLARIFRAFLERDLMQRGDHPAGVLR
ncbi:ParA family protein [Pseudonocardia sp. HH130630-07]|uniref:ParA family protein n=1 Tax=Pseudonocardia sp. HH130630-07 TaxID=1690815 RepID=UPI0008153D95|nr:ParA family protein [Pseudonocardia sp. HH130630-07]ANY10879.1 ATPase [Pseudonocardia sp. HH130630-07]